MVMLISLLDWKCNGIQKFDIKSFIRINMINHFFLYTTLLFSTADRNDVKINMSIDRGLKNRHEIYVDQILGQIDDQTSKNTPF